MKATPSGSAQHTRPPSTPLTSSIAGARCTLAALRLVGVNCLLLAGLGGCGGLGSADEALSTRSEDLSSGASHAGEKLFDKPFPRTNGRSCATCHVRSDHTTLQPAHVEELLASDPDNVLFNRIDADDPEAPNPTYAHLAKGLVRVVLTLAANLDVIDLAGNVTTPADRRIAVWRAVPSVENTAITAPYQYDGREATLQEQARGAILAHSQGRPVKARFLDRIADFEESLFTSRRARFVAEQFEQGASPEEIATPEDWMQLSAAERRGREVYTAGCEPCHGGATTRQITSDAVHRLGFFELGPEGYVRFDVAPGQPPLPRNAAHDNDGFLAGYSVLSYLGQIGAFPAFNASVALPHYRFRFYTDDTRSQAVTELPPLPLTLSGDPADPRPAVDADGAPLVGPNFIPQAFTTDPGRAAITGNPLDFEAFDVPQLRGTANTAPYFHDNSAANLEDVVDIYSRFVLGALPPLNLPPQNPPETPNTPPEALSPAQKEDLLAFLKRL